MSDPEAQRIPLKARAPWFAVWVPVALLLYTLVNGAGHVLVAYEVLWVCPPNRETDFVLRATSVLYGNWAFLIFPVLLVYAFVSWKLCPSWSAAVRWGAGMLSVALCCLFILAQVLLLCPNGWRNGMPSGAILRVYGLQLWKPHFCRPVLKVLHLEGPSPAWKSQCSDFASLIKDANSKVRFGAIRSLRNLSAKEYVQDITHALQDPNAGVRYEALLILSDLKSTGSSSSIAPLLKDPDVLVRCTAAADLGELGAKDYAPHISALLRDPDGQVRWRAVEALGKLGAKDFAPHISALLRDPHGRVRAQAAEALRNLAATAYVPNIIALLKDPDFDARRTSSWVLGDLTKQNFSLDDAGVLAAQAWWDEHKNDPEYVKMPSR